MAESEVVLVLGTFPNLELARFVSKTLVQEHLAACVNLFPQIESIYCWNGVLKQSEEVGFWLKTRPECYRALEARILELHPYEVPALVVLSVSSGLPAFLTWIQEQTQAGRS